MNEPVLIAENLSAGYGSLVIQHDLNFAIRQGEVFVIMGGSGCGKSTLLRHLIGLIGCHYGLSSGRNAQAVGQATTRAVVSIIVALVVSDALITLICTRLGI